MDAAQTPPPPPLTAYLLGGLHIALGLQDLLGWRRVSRGRVVGGSDRLPWGSHDESRLLRMLGQERWLEDGGGRVRRFRGALAAEADLPEGTVELLGLRGPEGGRKEHGTAVTPAKNCCH